MGNLQFFCIPTIDHCKGTVVPGVPRSPELFDGLLKNVHSTNSTAFLRTCQQIGSTYSVSYQYLRNNLVDLPFVLSIEDLSSPITRAILMAKMSAFINNKLGSRVDFSGQALKLVNTGNLHGARCYRYHCTSC